MANQEHIEVDIQLTAQDFLRANYWFLFKKFKPMIFLLLFVGIYLLFDARSRDLGSSDWGILIPWGMLLLIFGGTYVGAKRQMASNRSLNETHHFTFTEESIASVSPSTSLRQDWENIREAFETSNHFLLFMSLNQLHIIPKRCFQDDKQVIAFKNLLKKQIGVKAKFKG